MPQPAVLAQAAADEAVVVAAAAMQPIRRSVANDPYAKMGPLARPPQGSITKPLNPNRFDGKQFIDERTRSNDAGFLPSRGPNAGR